jgi:hypothetical protein
METANEHLQPLRPADVCKALLAALEASEGRRRKRKRDQTPDMIGLSIKRSLVLPAVGILPNFCSEDRLRQLAEQGSEIAR